MDNGIPNTTVLNQHGQVKTLDQVERDHVEAVYRYYHCNATRTSRALQIGRTTLYRKLRQYGVMK